MVAFSRGGGAVTVAPRLPVRLENEGGWDDTELPLPVGRWRCVLTGTERDGGVVPLRDLFAQFPVALLERAER